MRLRVAVFMLTGCSGCQLELLPSLLKSIPRVDVLCFKLVKEKAEDSYDVAFVEGAVDQRDFELLRRLRERARFLVALGTCSVAGGVSALKNLLGRTSGKAFPIEEVVRVDYRLRGCPISANEFAEVLRDLSIGKIPREKDYAVCVECEEMEIPCLLEKGEPCLGPIIYAGCDAICPAQGIGCWGCRGILDDANLSSFAKLLKDHGISLRRVRSWVKTFDHASKLLAELR
jgi:sulfhydrogenase subunit delta